MKLKEVFMPITPEINTAKATAEVAKMAGIMKNGLKGAGSVVSNVTKGAGRIVDKADRGLRILNKIKDAFSGIKTDVLSLTGMAGNIDDLAWSLDTSRNNLIQLYNAFGMAGMGDTGNIDEALALYHKAGIEGKVHYDPNADTAEQMMGWLEAVSKLSREEQDKEITKAFGAKKILSIHKLLGSLDGALQNIDTINKGGIIASNQMVMDAAGNMVPVMVNARDMVLGQASAAGELAALGDQVDYQHTLAQLNDMAHYVKGGALIEALQSVQGEMRRQNSRSGKYAENAIRGADVMVTLAEGLEQAIPEVFQGILNGIQTQVRQAETWQEKANPFFEIGQRIENILAGAFTPVGGIINEMQIQTNQIKYSLGDK